MITKVSKWGYFGLCDECRRDLMTTDWPPLVTFWEEKIGRCGQRSYCLECGERKNESRQENHD
jgi:hypothetical protein